MVKSIKLGDRLIEYDLIRKTVKNVNVTVRVDGSITVSANETVDLESIEAHIAKKAKFILRKLDEYKNIREIKKSMYILGKEVPVVLKLVEPKQEGMIYDGKQVIIGLRRLSDAKAVKKHINILIESLSQKILREHFDKGFEKCKKTVCVKPELEIKALKVLWSGCRTGDFKIVLNKLLVMLPEECIEYVVIHELCHFVSGEHDDEFYDTLDFYLAHWQESEELLYEYEKKIRSGLMPDYRVLNLRKEEMVRFYYADAILRRNVYEV